nr:unnamed protein product [Callosobruchus chinensis]
MVVLEVFSKSIQIKYKSTLLSKAAFIKIVTALTSIVVPFLLAYISGGFWVKNINFHEQPKVTLDGSYIFLAHTDNQSNPIVCSNIQFYENAFKNFDFCYAIRIRDMDQNFDGKIDKIDVELLINLFGRRINSLNLVLPIVLKLREDCPLTIHSAILYQHYFQQYSSHLKLIADLQLYQRHLLRCNDLRDKRLHNRPVITSSSQMDDYVLETMIEKYLGRNETTHLTNVYTTTKMENKDQFYLNLSVQFPEVSIYYEPGFWHILKHAWLQYFSIYIIISWIITKLKVYIFKKKLVLYYEETPLKKHL